MPSVLFQDAQQLVADHLRTRLPAESFPGPVVARIPNPRPDLFTVVTRTGGPAANKVTDAPLIVIDCWSTNQGNAMDRAQMARGILQDLPGTSIDGHPVYRVNEVGGPSPFPDPESDQPRARFTVEVLLRGATP